MFLMNVQCALLIVFSNIHLLLLKMEAHFGTPNHQTLLSDNLLKVGDPSILASNSCKSTEILSNISFLIIAISLNVYSVHVPSGK